MSVITNTDTWKIEQLKSNSGDYFRVLVHEGAISGLRYSTWIGVIYPNGKVNPWTPAASKPRNYGRDSRELLRAACEELRAKGLVSGPCRIPGKRR